MVVYSEIAVGLYQDMSETVIPLIARGGILGRQIAKAAETPRPLILSPTRADGPVVGSMFIRAYHVILKLHPI